MNDDLLLAKECIENSIKEYGLFDNNDRPYMIKSAWIEEFAEVVGSIDYLISEKKDHVLSYLVTFTFLTWLYDKKYISEHKRFTVDGRALFYLYAHEGVISENDRHYKELKSSIKNILNYVENQITYNDSDDDIE